MADNAGVMPQRCFVIMPISDVAGYNAGHFNLVYEHLIKPACIEAGFEPHRADLVSGTNLIVKDILRQILESELALCDLSGRNPNVLFELGIRQAFNLPVTLIKDRRTERIFDISGLRTLDYDESLRVDTVESAKAELVKMLLWTMSPRGGDTNSLMDLVELKPASQPTSVEITKTDNIILNAIRDLGDRLDSIDSELRNSGITRISPLAEGIDLKPVLKVSDDESRYLNLPIAFRKVVDDVSKKINGTREVHERNVVIWTTDRHKIYINLINDSQGAIMVYPLGMGWSITNGKAAYFSLDGTAGEQINDELVRLSVI